MSPVTLPPWAEEMRAIFRAETIGQFVLYGIEMAAALIKSADRQF